MATLQSVLNFLLVHSDLVVSLIAFGLILVTQRDWQTSVKDVAAGVFLDIENRFKDEVAASGPQKMTAAVTAILTLIPSRYSFLLDGAAFVFRTSRGELATKIAQSLYDTIRQNKSTAAPLLLSADRPVDPPPPAPAANLGK